MNRKEMEKFIVGVDPGKRGAFVGLLNGKIKFMDLFPLKPTTSKYRYRKEFDVQKIFELIGFLKEYTTNKGLELIFFVEEPLFISPGKYAIASAHYCYGILRGVLTSLKVRFFFIYPNVWYRYIFRHNKVKKKSNGWGKDVIADKGKLSIAYCEKNFPDTDFTFKGRFRNSHDGLTDATCIAVYGEMIVNRYKRYDKLQSANIP